MLVRAHTPRRPPTLLHGADGHARRAGRAPPRLADARLHPPPARPAGLPLAPPARLLLEVPARPAALQVLHDRHRRPAARRRRAGRRQLRHRAACSSPRSWASAGIAENSLDAVSNRDFVLDYLSAAATCATHLSQLGAEIVLWSSEEFGFCEVADRFASGSSLMPQKKNPDAAELLRAKAPRVVGRLTTLHGVLHGLPLTYNKDLQEDKEQLFDAIDTVELCLQRGARDAGEHHASTASGWPAAAPTSCWPPPTSPTCWSSAGVPVPRGARHRRRRWCARAVEQRQGAVRADRGGAGASWRPQLGRPSSTRCCGEGAWLESKVSEGGTSLARVREQLGQARHVLAARRTVSGAPLDAGLLRPPGARGGARTWSAASPPRRRRRADRRDRGLPRDRAGLPRATRA